MTNSEADGLLIGRDVFFASKITGTAAAIGLTVRAVPTMYQALASLREKPFRLVLVDLTTPELRLSELSQAPAFDPRPRFVAFAPHVHEAWLREAKGAGFDEVLTRGQLSASLPELLRRCMSP